MHPSPPDVNAIVLAVEAAREAVTITTDEDTTITATTAEMNGGTTVQTNETTDAVMTGIMTGDEITDITEAIAWIIVDAMTDLTDDEKTIDRLLLVNTTIEAHRLAQQPPRHWDRLISPSNTITV